MASGFFITFEGGEGTGKTTQARLLADRLRDAGHQVLLTREPGGAPGSEAIRALLVTGGTTRWSPLAETLLFAAARDEHLRTTIRPALAAGRIVICDRFADSTRAYQGAAGGVDDEIIATAERWVVGATRPDLTFILDIDARRGLERAGARAIARAAEEDRFERMEIGFHERLRLAFLKIAERARERCVVVNADRALAPIADEIARFSLGRLGGTR